MSNMVKQSAELVSMLKGNNDDEFREKFAEIGGEYLSTKVREDSIAEKILDVIQVDENHNQVQRNLDSDTFYYYEEIEQDGMAMEVSMRADAKPRFVDGKVYTINIGKIESETVKKPKMELRVSKNIVKFLKENNADWIRRVQDMVFMRTVRAALGATGTVIGANPSDLSEYSADVAEDWTEYATKASLTKCAMQLLLKELEPNKWLMSKAAYSVFSAMPASEIGDMAGEMLKEGFNGNILKMPVVQTIKSRLDDKLNPEYNRFFDYVDPTTGAVYSDIYLFTDPKFLGKLIKVDDDALWSKWEKDIFEWASWRYCGLGFGDIRGIAMMRVMLKEGEGQ